jgi:hypothetical protein
MKTSLTSFVGLLALLLFAVGCQHGLSVVRVDALDGMTEAQVISRFGAPTRRAEFPMSKALDEFRAALQKYHPLPQSQAVVIHELTWEQSQVFVTAWLHETNGGWRVFDSLRYGKDVVF